MRTKLGALLTGPTLVLALAGSLLVAPSASAAVHPTIDRARAYAAPQGGKGGILAPYVTCSDYSTQPSATWVLTDLGTGASRRWHWAGADHRTRFPRVDPGRYWSTIRAACAGTFAERAQTLVVTEKTARRTVSQAEFARIHRGMTAPQVAAVIGYPGYRVGGTAGHRMYRLYDRMAFTQTAEVVFWFGRVEQKYWVSGGGDRSRGAGRGL